ncbi:hypothetical protein Suden_0137 [Sulfurimonas denitrificans DSM 1251]|uniref:Flagellar hook-length control protein-like C-terminal domain-containing protein n=1 Tax=Sulfurimonas denitrificans (strain ATCC 33889 / DSM 1251) TaxID=326298 RepID=Q30UB3_SULDN|nr:flagellar hook-length control protein FliK [Sulfurimonas denitrificans]ABB43418.1 hypothetical protein Suden_0137 [Sulfurimonas denitrificans DSM 1251]MDD3442890.1 flagellar hook-length control protein FliK [Sulfurimonas denitrificans]
MINLSLDKHLGIMTPVTNKALAAVLREASPKEMEMLSKDKDLKSVITSLLKESSQNADSNKTLLTLVKNNPTLKDLGNVSSSIKDLLSLIKNDKEPLKIETVLKKFILDTKEELSPPVLKQKLQNSGVFLESKLKNVQNPQVELKNTLLTLEKSIEKSNLPVAKLVVQNIRELLATPTLRDATNLALLESPKDEKSALKNIAKEVAEIVSKLNGAQKAPDIAKEISEVISKLNEAQKSPNVEKSKVHIAEPIYSKETLSLTSKLTLFSDAQKLLPHEDVRDILSKDLKAILLKTSDEAAKSSHPNQSEITKHVDKLLLQIDYFQLLSHLSSSSILYVPFSWDALQEGSIDIKKDKNSVFYCDIDLKLKEYGELKLKLALYEENQINVHIYSDNKDFKEIVKENISSLRSALIEAQIIPKEIRIFDATKKNPSPYGQEQREINMGFEIKA